MKILAIRGNDIASLAREFDVDFEKEPLAGSGLFAITGPTGSGKSSILDALCLALFGQTSRLSGAGSTEVTVTPGPHGDGQVFTAKDPRNLLRRGAAQGSAEVDFLGVDGQRYRATWAVRRANLSPAGRVQDAKSSLSRLGDGVVLAQGSSAKVSKEVEAVLGLSFDQFSKAVLLAQGDFAAFLKAKVKERSDLLEKIAGGEIYAEVSRRAFQKKKAVEEELRGLKGDLDRLQPMDDGARKVAEERLSGIRERLSALDVRKGLAEAAARAVAEAEGLVKDAVLAAGLARNREAQAASAAERVAQAVENEKKAEGAADAARNARGEREHEIEEAVRLDLQLSQKLQEAGRDRAEAESSRQKAVEAAREAERLRVELAGVDGELAAAEDWLRKNDATKALSAEWEGIEQAFARLESVVSDLEGATKELGRNQTAFEKLEAASLRDAETVKALEAKFAEASAALAKAVEKAAAVDRSALVEERRALAARTEALSRLRSISETATAAKKRMEQAKGKALSSREVAEAEEQKRAAAEAEAARLEVAQKAAVLERDSAREARSLADYRPGLVPGHPCPLCGSIEHPWGSSEVVLAGQAETLDREVRQIEARLKAATTKAAEHRTRVEAELGNASRFDQDAERAAAELDEAIRSWEETGTAAPERKALARVLKAGPLADGTASGLADHAASANVAAGELSKREAEASSLELAREDARLLVDGLSGKIRTGKEKAEESASGLAKNREEAAGLRSRVEGGTKAKGQILDGLKRFVGGSAAGEAFLDDQWRPVRNRWKGQVEEFRKEEKTRESLLARKADLSPRAAAAHAAAGAAERAAIEKEEKGKASSNESGRLRSARAALLEGKSVEEVKKALEAAVMLAETGLSTAKKSHHEAVVARTASDTEFVGAKAAAGEAERKAGKSRQALSEALSPLGMSDVEDASPGLSDLLGKVERDRAAEVAQLRQADAAILTDDRTREQRVEAAARHLQAEEVGRVWIQLAKLIGTTDGAEFRTFAQGITLRTLLQSANAHLNDLAPRYQLRPVKGSDMELLVVDRDMGEEVRSIESLSGGESFLVSLALALGLASLASKRTSIRSLFIDEGFGSLDTDTLDKALSVLDGLQATGRRVGIISHVSALKDRIGVRVQVTPQGNGRSRVEVLAT